MYKEDEEKKDRSEAKQFDGMTIDTLSVEGRADEDYVPEGFESKELFLQDMRENFQADIDFRSVEKTRSNYLPQQDPLFGEGRHR